MNKIVLALLSAQIGAIIGYFTAILCVAALKEGRDD